MAGAQAAPGSAKGRERNQTNNKGRNEGMKAAIHNERREVEEERELIDGGMK